MRLVTWNCARGPYAKKVPLLDSLAPDIAVIQECARPTIESDQCLWFGDNPRQGLAVEVYGEYRLRALPQLEVPKYVIPVEVKGPANFLLFAVWAKHNPSCRYIEGVVKAIRQYREHFSQFETVLIGDLNSNAIWDSHHTLDLNHTALVELLDECGLVSSYHAKRHEAHGKEAQPTYYMYGRQTRPYHIDYCFIPKGWASGIQRVEVGAYDDWRGSSDHRPLLVEVNMGKIHGMGS
jgi:hypothetical protein